MKHFYILYITIVDNWGKHNFTLYCNTHYRNTYQ